MGIIREDIKYAVWNFILKRDEDSGQTEILNGVYGSYGGKPIYAWGNYGGIEDLVTLKFSGSDGCHSDDAYLFKTYDNYQNIPSGLLMTTGSSYSAGPMNFIKFLAMGKDVPKKINFQGFSAGCRSATLALGTYLAETSDANLESQHLTLCDPGVDGALANRLFSGGDASVYEEALKVLSDEQEQQILEKINEGYTDFKIPGITVDPIELLTYKSFKENKTVASIFVGKNGIDGGSGGEIWKWNQREDFKVLGACTEKFVTYAFNADHCGVSYTGSDGNEYEGINLIFNKAFSNGVLIGEEELKMIISHEQFSELGVFSKENGDFVVYTKDMLITENGDLTGNFYRVLSVYDTSDVITFAVKLFDCKDGKITLNNQFIIEHLERIWNEVRNNLSKIGSFSKNNYNGTDTTMPSEDNKLLNEYYKHTKQLMNTIISILNDTIDASQEMKDKDKETADTISGTNI